MGLTTEAQPSPKNTSFAQQLEEVIPKPRVPSSPPTRCSPPALPASGCSPANGTEQQFSLWSLGLLEASTVRYLPAQWDVCWRAAGARWAQLALHVLPAHRAHAHSCTLASSALLGKEQKKRQKQNIQQRKD